VVAAEIVRALRLLLRLTLSYAWSSTMQRIWTIGHSTRTADEFVAALQGHGIRLIADVRLLPGSRRYPHFDQDALAAELEKHGIGYEHFRELGGRRKRRPDSQNTAWRNDAFRGYADYMETPEFAAGVQRLLTLADTSGPTALLCAEAVWWRCHRGLVADYLKVRGFEVLHIVGAARAELHPFTAAARVVKGTLSYAA
jgi:uncharacterized protein (DUF488 family)